MSRQYSDKLALPEKNRDMKLKLLCYIARRWKVPS